MAPTALDFVERQTLLGKRLMVKRGNVGGNTMEFPVVRLLHPKESRYKTKALVDIEMFKVDAFYAPVGALEKFRERSRFALDRDLPVFRCEFG